MDCVNNKSIIDVYQRFYTINYSVGVSANSNRAARKQRQNKHIGAEIAVPTIKFKNKRINTVPIVAFVLVLSVFVLLLKIRDTSRPALFVGALLLVERAPPKIARDCRDQVDGNSG